MRLSNNRGEIMSNQKKFKAPQGWVTAVHINAVGITETAKRLHILPSKLAQAMEESGFQMLPDPMDLSADTAKVMLIEEQKTTPDLKLVEDPA